MSEAFTRVESPFDPATYRRDLEILPGDLNNAFVQQASLYAYYAERLVAMMRQESRIKLAKEIEEAKLDKAIRDRAAAEGMKITEPQIAAEIARTPSYVRLANAHNEAKAMVALAQSAVEAFKQRRDMLIQLGASAREEMKGEILIRERQNAANAVVQELRSRIV